MNLKTRIVIVLIFIPIILMWIRNIRYSYKDYINSIYGEFSSKDSLLCIIMTSEGTFTKRSIVAWNTWSHKCDRAYFACNCENITHALSLPYNASNAMFTTEQEFENAKQVPILQLNITESYNEMAEKIFYILKLVHKLHFNDFQWYYLCDDDTFTITDNLKKFISTKSSAEALTYGYNFKAEIKNGYHSGGAGILLTKESYSRIYNNIEKGVCKKLKTYGDIVLGLCAQKSSVRLGNSLDELGRERFHPLSIGEHYTGNYPDWLNEYAANKVKTGVECCSEESISFHYTIPEDMIKFTKFLETNKNFSEIYKII